MGAEHEHSHDVGVVHSHDDGVAHAHPHRHERRHVPERGAVLDIGGDIGAVLVPASAELDGEEIELYDERGDYVMHTEVHGRDVSGVRRYAGLFPAVAAGTYLLDRCDGSPREPITVAGGQVTTVSRATVGATP